MNTNDTTDEIGERKIVTFSLARTDVRHRDEHR